MRKYAILIGFLLLCLAGVYGYVSGWFEPRVVVNPAEVVIHRPETVEVTRVVVETQTEQVEVTRVVTETETVVETVEIEVTRVVDPTPAPILEWHNIELAIMFNGGDGSISGFAEPELLRIRSDRFAGCTDDQNGRLLWINPEDEVLERGDPKQLVMFVYDLHPPTDGPEVNAMIPCDNGPSPQGFSLQTFGMMDESSGLHTFVLDQETRVVADLWNVNSAYWTYEPGTELHFLECRVGFRSEGGEQYSDYQILVEQLVEGKKGYITFSLPVVIFNRHPANCWSAPEEALHHGLNINNASTFYTYVDR